MRTIDKPGMFAYDLAFGRYDKTIRVNPQADRTVRERSRHRIAVAVEGDKTSWRYALDLLDKAIEGPAQRHQAGRFLGMHIGHSAGHGAMLDLAPLGDALSFQPSVQFSQTREAGHRLPQPAPGILDILLDLTLLPARSRIAEIRLEKIMAGHCSEPGIDLPRLPRPDLVDSGPHVVEDAALRHTTQHPECLRQRVEQHLMGLKQIGSHDEGATMREFGMSDLQFRHFAVQHGIILAPVELEGLARLESQRNERPASAGLLFILKLGPPSAGKGGHPVIGAIVTQLHQIHIELLGGPLLLAGFLGFHPQPSRQLVREGIEFAGAHRNPETGLHRIGTQVFANGIAR